MIIKMTLATAVYIILTVVFWKLTRNRAVSIRMKLLIGLVYGGCSVLSTHIAVDYRDMLLNVRDLGPLSAGLFFDPFSGILAGLIGGIERYIAGTYWTSGPTHGLPAAFPPAWPGLFPPACTNGCLRRKRLPRPMRLSWALSWKFSICMSSLSRTGKTWIWPYMWSKSVPRR